MKRQMILLAALGLGVMALAQTPAFAEPRSVNNPSVANPNGCKVVERKGGTPSGALSSTVTAGGGHVSASTSGGNGVTVYSGSGSGGVATAGTASNGRNATTVMSSNGDCTIYVDPGSRK
ncbi:MAG TPA: hypothetical protein VG651_07260 [Stellaceae bacterium]|nr:hypothetical protein [Stellaceae bacterium]